MPLTLNPGDVFTAAYANSLAVSAHNETITGQWTFSNSVGIGTSSPTAKCHVVVSDGEGTTYPYVGKFINNDTTSGESNGIIIYAGATSSDVSFEVDTRSGSPLLKIKGDGNVGILTASPVYALDISGSCRISNNLAVGTTPTTYPFQVLGSNAGNYAAHIYNSSATGYGVKIRNGDDTKEAIRISNAADNADNIQLYGSGNGYFAGKIGIGVAIGSYPLTLKGASDHLSWLNSSGTEKGRLGIQASGTEGWLALYNSSSQAALVLGGNGQVTSTLATGTKPLVLTSTTLCDNLNADMVDGLHSTDFLRSNMSVVYAHRDSTQAIADITATTLIYATEDYDSGGEYDTSTGIFTATSAGYYQVSAGVNWVATSVGVRHVFISKNNASAGPRVSEVGNSTWNQSLTVSALIYLAASDTVRIKVWQNSGASLDIVGDEPTFLSIARIK